MRGVFPVGVKVLCTLGVVVQSRLVSEDEIAAQRCGFLPWPALLTQNRYDKNWVGPFSPTHVSPMNTKAPQ